jgi:hypothetical protein
MVDFTVVAEFGGVGLGGLARLMVWGRVVLPSPPHVYAFASTRLRTTTTTTVEQRTQVVIERQEDAKGNQWFEMTQESCELIGFQVSCRVQDRAGRDG